MAKDYLFEIGTEEMPAHVVPRSVKQLADRTRKFLKENHFALNKENIQQVSQNIAQNRANNKKQNRDSSVEAAYRIEKEKLSDPATRSNYQKKYKKSSKTNETRKIDSPLIQNNDLSR